MKRFEFELDGKEYAYERVLPDEGKAGAFTEYVVANVNDQITKGQRPLYRLFFRPYTGTPAEDAENETTRQIADINTEYFLLVGVAKWVKEGKVFLVICDMWRRMSHLTDRITDNDLNEKGGFMKGDPPGKARARAIQGAYSSFETKIVELHKKNITFLDVNENAFTLDNMVKSPDGKALFMYDFSAKRGNDVDTKTQKDADLNFFPLHGILYDVGRWNNWIPRSPVYN